MKFNTNSSSRIGEIVAYVKRSFAQCMENMRHKWVIIIQLGLTSYNQVFFISSRTTEGKNLLEYLQDEKYNKPVLGFMTSNIPKGNTKNKLEKINAEILKIKNQLMN